ncbi:MAG: cytochrome c553 [Pirellulaceae bacterium]|jgi:cytochrome c553
MTSTFLNSRPVAVVARLCFLSVPILSLFFFVAVNVSLGDDAIDQAATKEQAARAKVMQLGQQVFSQKCVSCHGAKGEGVKDGHEDPLVGDATISELTKVIHETMPEEEPEECVDGDAIAVATYIYHSFYSESARAANSIPRKRLTRLTAEQLRQSLADLYGHYSWVANRKESGGLQAEYFDDARPRRDKRRIERVDSTIDFDFGEASPGENINAKEYSIQWFGSVKPSESGRYEIVIRSTCAFICSFGSTDQKFINNHVQSGDQTEFRRMIALTSGRVYPIKIEAYQRKRKTKQPPVRVSLSWVPPGGAEQIIPTRNLIPENAPSTFALQTMLPPDDRSYGYSRGINVSREWDESTTNAAIEFGQVAADELWPAYRRSNKSGETRDVLKKFLVDFVETAFRGPLDDELRQLYIQQQIDATKDDSEAIKRVVLITLKSPRFLYPALDRDRSASQRVANQLALILFDSLPSDSWLVSQAKAKQLDKEPQIRAAAQKMANDYRFEGKIRQLLFEWMNLGHFEEIGKNNETYPGFDGELVMDLKQSLVAFVDDVVWSEASDYRQLIQADWTYTTPKLASFYGEKWQPAEQGEGLRKSVADRETRAGVLSHPYLMSGLAYPETSSPIHRGVFLIRYVLGRTLRPPNAAFTPFSAELHPALTTRQRVELQTGEKNCQVCHQKINGLGFTLENFDAVGRYRLKEKEREIDAKGSYTTRDDKSVALNGPRELADFLTNSEDAHRAFVHRAFQYFVKQPPAAYGENTLDELTRIFKESGFNIRKLVIEIAVVAAMQETGT